MKIVTFNVNGVNGRLPVLMRWLAEAKPDVVCLQELKAQDEKFPEPAIREAGYRAVWHGQKSWNGVAILARDKVPIETRPSTAASAAGPSAPRRTSARDQRRCRGAPARRPQQSQCHCGGLYRTRGAR